MNKRRFIGIVLALTGIVVSIGHLISRTPERYHGHELLVVIGLALTVIGILLLSREK